MEWYSAINSPVFTEIGASAISNISANVLGLGRPAAVGAGRIGSAAFVSESSASTLAPASQTRGAAAWSTAPTAPTSYLRRMSAKANVGDGVVWLFPRGLQLAASSSLVIWNIANNAMLDTWAVIDE